MSDPLTLGLASTAVSLVNGTIGLLKEAREAAKRSDDHDLKDKLSDVYDSVLELKDTINNLREENAELRKQLNSKETLKWNSEMRVYVADGDPDPYCPICLDRDGKQMRLHPQFSNGVVWIYDCKVCKNHFNVEK
jgi:hypothetical protein